MSAPIPHLMTPGTALAVVAVTAGALTASRSSPALPALIALCVVHAGLGTLGIYVIERRGTRTQLSALFALATAVAVGAVVLGRGEPKLLVLSLISQTVLYLPIAGVAAISAICTAVVFAMLVRTTAWPAALDEIAGWTAAEAFVLGFSYLLVRQRRSAAELAVAEERNRIAREIHDGLGHYLTVAHVQLEAATEVFASDPAQAERAMQKAQALIRDGLDEVRSSVAVLRGAASTSLIRTIEKLARDCADAGLAARVEIVGAPRPLAEPVAWTLYRAAQEGITNVRRHARASSVRLELAFDAADRVRLRIEDDGDGAAAAAPVAGFGLVGLRERAALVGGTVSTGSGRERGFTLELELPG